MESRKKPNHVSTRTQHRDRILIHQQRRNAFIASTTIAVLSITLLMLLLSIYLLRPIETTDDRSPIDVVKVEARRRRSIIL